MSISALTGSAASAEPWAVNRTRANQQSAASGLRQTDCILFSLALARVTFARMSEAFAVQMNGFG